MSYVEQLFDLIRAVHPDLSVDQACAFMGRLMGVRKDSVYYWRKNGASAQVEDHARLILQYEPPGK